MTLSKIQKDIVNSKERNIIVDAGSGSGKTRVLTERVKRLLKEGNNPKSIVVITFTNLAADELYERLKDVEGSDKCFIGTIHSYANKLLKKTGMQFEIFSEYYQTQFMTMLIPKYAKYCSMDDYLQFVKYDRMVSAGRMSKKDVCSKFTDPKVYHEIMSLLGREYSSYYKETVLTLCKANNVISFDELLKLTTDYFKENKLSLEYLFVDELQDVGYLEYEFLMSLNAKNNFVIGDDYQEIYKFKGGDVNIFLGLMNNDDWYQYYLTENYRTAKSILRYANAIIAHAWNIIKKDVVYKNDNEGELKFLAKSMLDSFLSGLKENEDWFILTRSNKEMVQIDTILSKLHKEHYCFKQSTMSPKKIKEIMSKPCIKVLTVHSSKGLECENVALYGKFPVKPKVEKQEQSDEIKVFYVGITRAKNRCIIFV